MQYINFVSSTNRPNVNPQSFPVNFIVTMQTKPTKISSQNDTLS
jgi:hypothetical protein